jgi:hypothetical protein
MLSRFSEPYEFTINVYTLYRVEYMNSRFSKKRVLLYSGVLAFAMSSAYADEADVTPLVFANNYVSTGAGAQANGDIQANNYVTTGANSSVIGNIRTGAAATLGSDAKVLRAADGGGNILADAAITLGVNAVVEGFVTHGSAFTLTMGASSSIYSSVDSTYQVPTFGDQQVIGAQAAYRDKGGKEGERTLAPTITTNTTLIPGVYSAASLATTAGITITLDANFNSGNWIFNITDILSFGANTTIELINPVAEGEGNNRIIWNSGGHTSVGAGAEIKGTILAHTYVSTGAGSKLSGVDSCGGIFSATSYVSIGANSEVGSEGCATKSIDIIEELTIPNEEMTTLPNEDKDMPNGGFIKAKRFNSFLQLLH